MTESDLDQVIEQNHAWLAEFIKGNVDPAKKMFSHRDDVTLAGLQATVHTGMAVPVAHGWREVAEGLDRSVSHFKEGEITAFENITKYATADVAWTVEVEKYKAKVAGGDLSPIAQRVTSIFRREDGVWKLVHRHTDPIVTAQLPESIILR